MKTARSAFWVLALSVLAASAWAGPNAGGTLILSYQCSLDEGASCAEGMPYENLLTDCESAVTQVTPASLFPPPLEERHVWFVYAAFPPSSLPRLKAVQFGIDYTQLAGNTGVEILFDDYPPDNFHIETTSPRWPAPGSGLTISFGTTMTALVSPICSFGGYGSAGQVFTLRDHPSLPSQFADDSLPSLLDDVTAFGSLGFGVSGDLPCPGPALGACCFSDGSCVLHNPSDCAAHGGTYWGAMTSCFPNPCPQPPVSCCFQDGHCEILPPAQCTASGGTVLGTDACEPNPCPQPGACCQVDGSCLFVPSYACYTGDFRPDVPCDPNPCPQPVMGACCFPDGHCTWMLNTQCSTGAFLPGVPCTPNPCPQPPRGACCYSDGHCAYVTPGQCNTGDFRPDVPCTPNPCPQPPAGACCYVALGTCSLLTEAQCTASGLATHWWLGPGTSCSPDPCTDLQVGACCNNTTGACLLQTPEGCAGDQTWLGAHSVCSPNPCPPPVGACCFIWSGDCQIMTPDECFAADGYWVGGPCEPDPCYGGVPIERTSWGRIKNQYR